MIDQFCRDVRNAAHREMKQLARAVWRKYEPQQTVSAAGTASPPADTDGDQSVPVSGEPSRGPRPDRESLLVNKRSVTRLEAAEYLGLSPRQVYNLVREGHLVRVGAGKNMRIDVESLRQRRAPEK